jgi:thiol-disulfide isomerase/thioredoxin
MKNLILLFILTVILNLAANAQERVFTTTHKLDENSIIRDSSGMQYPYIIWKKMMSTGDYMIKRVGPITDSAIYLITKLTDDEKDLRYNKMPKPAGSPVFTNGDKINSFSANDIDGKKLKLKDLAGKVVVLNFWFIGCPPCRMELPDLNKLALKYANDPNVVFIAIALDQSRDIKEFIKTNPIAYHIIDDGQIYANMYKIHLFPTNVVLNKEGKVIFHSVGYAANTPYWIKKTIEEAKQASL